MTLLTLGPPFFGSNWSFPERHLSHNFPFSCGFKHLSQVVVRLRAWNEEDAE